MNMPQIDSITFGDSVDESEKQQQYWYNLIPRLGWDNKRLEQEFRSGMKLLALNSVKRPEVLKAKCEAIKQIQNERKGKTTRDAE